MREVLGGCALMQGLPQLQEWTQEHVSLQHDPPGPFQVLVSNGSNHAIEVSCLLCDRGHAPSCCAASGLVLPSC